MSELAAHCVSGAALNRAASLGSVPGFLPRSTGRDSVTSFRKERRMKSAVATTSHRKSGAAEGSAAPLSLLQRLSCG